MRKDFYQESAIAVRDGLCEGVSLGLGGDGSDRWGACMELNSGHNVLRG